MHAYVVTADASATLTALAAVGLWRRCRLSIDALAVLGWRTTAQQHAAELLEVQNRLHAARTEARAEAVDALRAVLATVSTKRRADVLELEQAIGSDRPVLVAAAKNGADGVLSAVTRARVQRYLNATVATDRIDGSVQIAVRSVAHDCQPNLVAAASGDHAVRAVVALTRPDVAAEFDTSGAADVTPGSPLGRALTAILSGSATRPRRAVAVDRDVAVTQWPSALSSIRGTLLELVDDALELDPTYDLLIDHFHAAHGGDASVPLVEFCVGFTSSTEIPTRNRGLPADADPGSHHREVDLRIPRPLPACHVQPLAGPGPTAVLNDLTAYGAGAIVRHASPAAASELSDHLRRLVVETVGAVDGRIVELPIAAEDGRSGAGSGLGPILKWPTELAGGGADEVSTLRCTVRLDGGVLVIVGPDGDRLLPVYTGIVPTHLSFGPLRALLTIAQPWRLAADTVRSYEPRLGEVRPLTGIEHTERILRRDLVIDRERWTMPAGALPDIPTDPFEAIVRLDGWRRTLGLPVDVFVRIDTDTSTPAGNHREPMFVSFTSPHLVAAITSTLPDAVNVEFTEMLPGPEQIDGDRHVGEYLLVVPLPIPNPHRKVEAR